MRPVLNIVVCLLAGLLLLSLSACGGSNNATSGPAGSGSVAILFTDAPTDEFSEINVTVNRIILLGDDDQSAPEIYSGKKTINLLDLEYQADLFSLADNVPAGKYAKIRLVVSNVELVKKDENGAVVATITPKLPGNGKIDLNPRGALEVTADRTLMLELDFDARKSIHYHALGNGGYILRPVIFIKQLTNAAAGKLVRISGTVADLDDQAQTFRLCRTSLVHREMLLQDGSPTATHIDLDDGAKWCPAIQITADTALFDQNGEPMTLASLGNDEHVTVLGRFDHTAGSPALTALAVLAGPPGTFRKYSGVVTSGFDAATSRIGMRLDDGQGITGQTDLDVQLQDVTLIMLRDGTVLDSGALAVGAHVKVAGILSLSSTTPDVINAAIIFVDTDADIVNLGGTISTVDPSLESFTLVSNSVGDRCVTLTDRTDIFVITNTAGRVSSEQVDTAALAKDQPVEVYGRYDLEGCLVAKTVLATAD